MFPFISKDGIFAINNNPNLGGFSVRQAFLNLKIEAFI